jgi:hypothetical protein
MVQVVELAACVAPACNLDQRRLTVGREPFEPGIPVGMQKAPQVPSSASAWLPWRFAE